MGRLTIKPWASAKGSGQHWKALSVIHPRKCVDVNVRSVGVGRIIYIEMGNNYKLKGNSKTNTGLKDNLSRKAPPLLNELPKIPCYAARSLKMPDCTEYSRTLLFYKADIMLVVRDASAGNGQCILRL